MKPPANPVLKSDNHLTFIQSGPLALILLLSLGLGACTAIDTEPDTMPATAKAASEPEKIQPQKLEAAAVPEKKIRLKQTRQYVVKKGDTLWDISSMFLRDPWYWPEVWHKNRQVQNPHLIFPGDVLTLVFVDKQPQIMVTQTTQPIVQQQPETAPPAAVEPSENLRVVKIGPQVRREGLDASVPSIPGDAIRQFLTKPRVVTEEEIEAAPYILASLDDHLILGQDNRVYVRGEIDKDRVRYTTFRPGKELIDPETDDTLGYEAIYTGEIHITNYGDPAIGILTKTEREVLLGDRLLPQDKSQIANLYFPKVPDTKVQGQIVSLFDALFAVGKYQIAVINRGARDGIEIGHLLATLNAGTVVEDYFNPDGSEDVKLPDERSGLLMIFETFDQVSYGLVLESTRVIRNHDTVVTPR